MIYLFNKWYIYIYLLHLFWHWLWRQLKHSLFSWTHWTGSGVPLEPLEALRLSHNAIGDISAVASLVWICLDELQEKFRRAYCFSMFQPYSILLIVNSAAWSACVGFISFIVFRRVQREELSTISWLSHHKDSLLFSAGFWALQICGAKSVP